MKIFKTVLAATALTVFATSALAGEVDTNADTGAYLTLGAGSLELFDGYVVEGRLGYELSKYFSVEGQAAYGIQDVEETFGKGQDASLDQSYAGYVRGSVPLTKGFDLFARVGFHFTNISSEVNNPLVLAGVSNALGEGSAPVAKSGFSLRLDQKSDGISYGGGTEFSFDEANGLRFEYTYLDVNELDGGTNILSLAFVRKL